MSSKNIVWTPYPKQAEFLSRPETEVFFGGSAGGGKSEVAVIEIARDVMYSDYRGIVFRKTIKQLNNLIDKSKVIYPKAFPGAKFNNSDKVWLFPSGAKIYFCSLQNPDSKLKFQGQEYGCILFDELQHFTFEEYSYMLSRLRSTNPLIRPRIRATGNPGGVGNNWIRERFINLGPNKRFVEEVQATDPTGKVLKFKRSRIFIPSSVFDNPYLMKTDYVANLALLPEKERKALLDGDWNSFEGQYFPEFNSKIHVIQPVQMEFKEKFICLDYGLDMLAMYLCGVTSDESIYILKEVHKPNLDYYKFAQEILAMSKGQSVNYIVASPDIWNRKQETGKDGEQILREYGVYKMIKANNARIQGWRNLRDYLRVYTNVEGYETAKLKIFSTCTNLINNIPVLLHDTNNVEDASNFPHDVTHSCLTGDTLINTTEGLIQIKDLVEKEGTLHAFDTENNKKVIGNYYDVRKTAEKQKVFEIETEDGRKFKVTENHKILTQDGWKMVKDLTDNDFIINIIIETL